MRPLRYLVVAAVASLPLAAPHALHAQSYAQVVWDQLQTAYRAADDQDYALRNYVIGGLAASGTDSWTFALAAGRQYMVIAACDNDCSDVDLVVKNEKGETVASDLSDDDVPVVIFKPEAEGRHTIEVKMYACSEEPCYFGFGIFRK